MYKYEYLIWTPLDPGLIIRLGSCLVEERQEIVVSCIVLLSGSLRILSLLLLIT